MKVEHDIHLYSLLGSFLQEVNTSVSSAFRRHHEVGRGQPFTVTSPDTIPRICSPFPALVTRWAPPFTFAQETCFKLWVQFLRVLGWISDWFPTHIYILCVCVERERAVSHAKELSLRACLYKNSHECLLGLKRCVCKDPLSSLVMSVKTREGGGVYIVVWRLTYSSMRTQIQPVVFGANISRQKQSMRCVCVYHAPEESLIRSETQLHARTQGVSNFQNVRQGLDRLSTMFDKMEVRLHDIDYIFVEGRKSYPDRGCLCDVAKNAWQKVWNTLSNVCTCERLHQGVRGSVRLSLWGHIETGCSWCCGYHSERLQAMEKRGKVFVLTEHDKWVLIPLPWDSIFVNALVDLAKLNASDAPPQTPSQSDASSACRTPPLQSLQGWCP